MNFDELIAVDIRGVFLNPVDFGKVHNINGTDVICVIDKNNIHIRGGGGRVAGGRREEGVREGSFFLYIDALEFENKPMPHEQIEIDGHSYFMRDVSDEDGIYIIECGEVSNGKRIHRS